MTAEFSLPVPIPCHHGGVRTLEFNEKNIAVTVMVQFGEGLQIGRVLAALEQIGDTGLQLIRQRPHTLHTLLKVDFSHLPGKSHQIEGTFE